MSSGKDELHYSLEEQEAVPTFQFMLKCLLYSRLQTGLVSNRDYYDEDVNVYVAHLLEAFLKPDYIDRVRPYLSQYDTDVFRKLEDSEDARLKYTIYKSNADFLLVSMGIFEDATAMDPEKRRSGTGGWWEPSEEAYVGRGQTYYRFAYTYSQQLPRRNSGVSEVLEKLAVGYERYLRILSHMRGEYFDIMDRLSNGEVYHLQRSIDEVAAQETVKEKQDELLDLFTTWMENQDENTYRQLQDVLAEIRALDPNFRFDLPAA